MSSVKGYEMSSEQLNDLWRLENTLAHYLLGMPLRQCSAEPCLTWGKPMASAEFEQLKTDIRKMWCRAGQFFVAVKSDVDSGWGLQVRGDLGKKLSITENSFTILGWLVKAPSPKECGTGHRYWRSPAFTDLYLGGPISLSQFSKSPTLLCWKSVSGGPSKNYVYVRTVKPIEVNSALTWTYNLHQTTAVNESELFTIKEWQLDACCSEDVSLKQCTTSSKPTVKLDKPTKQKNIVQSFMWCTYCGKNLENDGVRVNRKEHWALHHTVQICKDMNAPFDEVDPKHGVDPKKFKMQLELIDGVLKSLRNYNYTVLPACHFFENVQGEAVSDTDDERKKEVCFKIFKEEAKEAYRKYKVVYLSGVKIPQSFKDLLSVPVTHYLNVVWLHNLRPRSNSFAIVKDLSPFERDQLSLDIITEVQNIVTSYL